jgi:hypothetical protein
MTGLLRKKPMLSRNNARLKKRRAAQFGKQAEACRARNDVDLITMATELAATLKEDPNG